MTSDEKQAFANEAERAVKDPLVQEVIDEQLRNLGVFGQALPKYGLNKIAQYAATVARAHALGIDPDELRTTPDEYGNYVQRMAQAFTEAGKPVIIVSTSDAQS